MVGDSVYFHRALEDCILEASRQFSVILLTGPRQVGKTTLLQHLREEQRACVTLDDLGMRALANTDPALFLQRFPPPVLIDEIQYAPSLLPYIKMDSDKTRKSGDYWLTGSQQFHVMKGVTESLAGRVAVINLLGFSGRENSRRDRAIEPFLPTSRIINTRLETAGPSRLGPVFSDIWYGWYPSLRVGTVRNRDLFFGSYIQTYIERDVRDLVQIGNQESFLRFLKACAARTAQLLNLSELARDTDISVPTAKHWLSILQASFQVYLVPPYHGNATKRLIKAPKLYFLDTGLCAYLTEWSSPETLSAGAMNGAIFETHAFTEILKSWWHRLRRPNLFYYRDKDGKEIDFLFEQDRRLYPVEVKMAATTKTEWVRSFSVLDRLKMEVGEGAVLCLTELALPLTRRVQAVPVGVL